MVYVCEISTNQAVYLDNQGMQTIVTSVNASAGQQQQTSSSFITGQWTSVPQMFQTAQGVFLLKVNGTEGERFIAIQGNSLSILTNLPNLHNSQPLHMQSTGCMPTNSIPNMPPMQPMEPMKPMQPMQPMQLNMGDMSMNMNPMAMRMGNMAMEIGKMPTTTGDRIGEQTTHQSTKNFCSQCGNSLSQGDRFCSHCGHQLD